MPSSLPIRLPSSASIARSISSVVLVGFLYCSYEVIRTEVEMRLEGYQMPREEVDPTPAERTQHRSPRPQLKGQPAESAPSRRTRPVHAKPLPHKGSRREWYEKRKRRWFTPPDPKLDQGLPKAGARFKMA
jgi:hypothetical protein